MTRDLQAEYAYDGVSDRLRQVDYTGAMPITTTYSNDVFGLTQVLVADDGTAQVYNLFGLDLISQDSGSEVRTLLVDGLGSVRLEMVGGVVETATTYSPYGEVLAQVGTSGTVYGFIGEQEDEATGLLYLRARYYNSSLKSFQSRDPWEGSAWKPQTLNYYTYVQNQPVRYTDPSGYCTGNPDGIGNTFEEQQCWTKVHTIANMWELDEEWWSARFGSLATLWELAELEVLDTAYWEEQILAFHEAHPVESRPPTPQPRLTADGIAIFGALSPGTQGVQVAPVAGIELLWNLHSADQTVFAVLGGGVGAAIGETVDIVLALVYNIGSNNLNYSGMFHSLNANFAGGFGVAASESWTPGDPRGENDPASSGIGISCGAGAGIVFAETEYIPIYTVNLVTWKRTYHAYDYLYYTGDGRISNLIQSLSQNVRQFAENVLFE